MRSSRPASLSFLIRAALACLFALGSARAQSGRVPEGGTPRPTPAASPEGQDRVTVFTEEVRIPVFARDEYERFDPTLAALDVLVLEDGVPQQVRSVRRIPASIVLLVSTGGELNPALSARKSREAALKVVKALREGDSIAVMQFDKRVELLQDWTTDKKAADEAVRNRLQAGSGARTAEGLKQAAALLAARPLGNRHIVFITDGVDTPGTQASASELTRMVSSDAMILGGRNAYADALRQVQNAQATVHVISYTSLGRREIKERARRAAADVTAPPGSVRASGIPTAGVDPTMPSTASRGVAGGPSRGDGILFDSGVKKLRRAYERAMQRSEQQLKTLTAETGGRIFLPLTDEELIAQGAEVAQEIGTQYVVTYTPKRPLAGSPPSEYRRLTINPRRSGLTLRSRRGYVTATMK